MTDQRQLAKIIADSLSPDGVRLTTMEIQVPRIVLAEFNTHRCMSRNSASSRAIPIEKMLARAVDDPYIPETWGRNGKGMQAHGLLDGGEAIDCVDAWLRSRDRALVGAQELLDIGVHKQTTNRLLEPFLWHTVIVTATEWSNFFHLRDQAQAHPAIANTAKAMREARSASTPSRCEFGQWHLPYVDERDDGMRTHDKIKLSSARCARVSYLTHDGVRAPEKDIELHDGLLSNGHMSPFEHVARPLNRDDVAAKLLDIRCVVAVDRSAIDVREYFSGNFRGWQQYRKTIANEADILASRD